MELSLKSLKKSKSLIESKIRGIEKALSGLQKDVSICTSFPFQAFALRIKLCHHDRMLLHPLAVPGGQEYIWWLDNPLPHMKIGYSPCVAPWTGRVFIEFLRKKNSTMDSKSGGIKYRRMTLLPTSNSIKWRSITTPGSPAIKALTPLLFEAHLDPAHIQLSLSEHPVTCVKLTIRTIIYYLENQNEAQIHQMMDPSHG